MKSGAIAGVIVMSNNSEWLRLPLVPMIATKVMALGVSESTVSVAVEVAVLPDGRVTLVGENVT